MDENETTTYRNRCSDELSPVSIDEGIGADPAVVSGGDDRGYSYEVRTAYKKYSYTYGRRREYELPA